MLDLGQELAERRAHDSEDLESQDVRNDYDQAGDDEESLDVELDEAAARLPVEAAPCVHEADDASAAHELGDDFAAEGAVEGDDCVLVLGEDGGLDADEGDDCGDAEEQGACDGEDEESDDADDQGDPLRALVSLEVLVLELVETEEHAEPGAEVDGDVGHGGLDGGGEREGLPVALGGNALPEGLLCGCADNLVGPCGVDVCDGCAGESGDEDGLAGDVGERAREELGDEGEDHGVEDVEAKTAEAGKAATVGNEVPDGAADAGGNRLLVDEGDGRASLEQTLLLLLVTGLVGGRGDGNGSDGALHHAECGDNLLEHVRNLCLVSLARLQVDAWANLPG